jgi:mono/diheme cytochrome c family protein
MKRDFKSCMLYALFGLPIFLILFIAVIYFANCGFSGSCAGVGLPAIIHTPIPTLIPVKPVVIPVSNVEYSADCMASASDLLGSWVGQGYQETQPFDFQDINGNSCQATFSDIEPLFTQANLWYQGALSCDSCHDAELSAASAGLDISTYSGILAGAGRTSSSSQGQDILGGGNWTKSILYQQLFVSYSMPYQAPAGSLLPTGPVLQAGSIVVSPSAEATPGVEQPEIARPSNPGGPGEAINLTGDATSGEKIFSVHCYVCHGEAGTDNVINPGSDDGTVPPLNPIDDTMVSADYQVFAYNIDLFVENGSEPPGINPTFHMPDWGAAGALTQQDIADVIAYIISLNP